MMNQLDLSIIEKVKSILGVDETFSSMEFYDKLWSLRNNYHPDRFFEKDLKKKAEEKFKEIGLLLNQLSIFINNEKLTKKYSDIMPYEREFEIIKSRQEIIRKEDKINNLTTENERLQKMTKNLESELSELRSKKIEEKEKELISLYKPSRKNIISVGITFFLTAMASILLKIEDVAKIVAKYSPLKEDILNAIIFTIFLVTIFYCFKRYLEGKFINIVAKKVGTASCIREFADHLARKEKKDYFSEFDVYTFLEIRLVPKSKPKKFFFTIILNIYNEATLDSLKDIFIYNLFCKSLIYLYDANNLERYLRVKKSYIFN